MTELLYTTAAFAIVILAFLLYHTRAHYLLKLSFPIALIAGAILGYTIFTDSMGAPIRSVPDGDFQYIHHQAGNGGEVIYLWIWTAERGNRLYVFNYDRETMEQLEKAKGRAEGGQEYGQFNKNESGFVYEEVGDPYETEEGFEK